ncbi:ECF transporter S component [Candidatus Soleaferrea massiliensis]|uniref:ECF transporter S component n=1 Tax=Candidatus Soleaferrea massiliensis TaxID=1470354 RepID=UPI00058BB649|nr:ECF transporter S component [Candidatus Soleaferrea massiliensis]
MKNKTTRTMVQIALLCAIEIVLALTPLGFIPLGFTRATTIHIPVIIGACLMGPAAGGFLGGVFGVLSLLINTFTPTATSFVFTPFYSVGNMSGNLWSVVIALVPRILIGVVAGYLFRFFTRKNFNQTASLAICGVAGSLVNTLLVMGGIYVFFGDAYAAAQNKPIEALFGFIMGIIGVNGVPEAIVAGILVAAITKILLAVNKRRTI